MGFAYFRGQSVEDSGGGAKGNLLRGARPLEACYGNEAQKRMKFIDQNGMLLNCLSVEMDTPQSDPFYSFIVASFTLPC